MHALDGNAIAGPMSEYFGAEMTMARGSCAHCGASAQVAELRVYPRAPGVVARCPTCDEIVLVLVTIRDALRIDGRHFQMTS